MTFKSNFSLNNAGGNNTNNIAISTSNFKILTGDNLQTILEQIDSLLVDCENRGSLLYSLDPLEDIIDAQTTVPLPSLQAKDFQDGRPSHKAAGAKVYDDFGTIGYIDKLDGQGNAIITTVSSRIN